MKRFLLHIIYMMLLLLGINWCVDLYVSHRLQHSEERMYVGWNDIITTQLNADLLVMGNSRAWVMYDSYILDSILGVNSYNIGIDGSPFNRQIAKYNIYATFQNKKPQYIVLNIDHMSMIWREGYEREQFFPYMWYPSFRREIKKVEPLTIAELYMPLYRYTTYKGIWDVVMEEPENVADLYKGYAGQERVWDGTAYNKIDTVHFEIDNRTLEMLDAFLSERQKEGIRILFCYAPIYIGVIGKMDNYSEMRDFYQMLADRYDIPILDYTYSDISMDTMYFYNATHLNKTGAELFSIQLAHDLDSIGVKCAK